ncbi:MAG: hypothetical protein ACM3O8_00370, partial [Methylococcaceae bacterium]
MKVIRKILVIFGWLCLVGLIGFSIYFVYSQRENVRCKTIVVNISPDSPRFMDEEEITQMIEKSGEPIIDHRLFDINIDKLES